MVPKKAVVVASKQGEGVDRVTQPRPLGLPSETKTKLVPPEPFVEDTSLEEAVDTARGG